MAVIAAGARFDPQSKTIQAVVVITDDDGNGHPDHLNPHKLLAAQHGHVWVDIPQAIYKNFLTRADVEAYISTAVASLSVSAP